MTVQLADGSESPGDHGESCSECGRYAEQARAVWDAVGRLPAEPVPADVSARFLRAVYGSRRLLLPAGVAAAAALLLGALILFVPAPAGPGSHPLMEPDGMTVERYDLPAGTSPSAVAEELRRKVAPEAWTEGVGGLEEGAGFLRVRGPAELQRAVREFLRRYGK